MASPFRFRGVVEGYYGRPLSNVDRHWLIDRMADWGMNTYVYAPKDDPLHRERWRDPYPAESLAALGELVDHGDRRGVRVGFAIAPGLSIAYASESDREALWKKVDAFLDLGAKLVCLALDDVPTRLVHEEDRARFESLAAAHVDLAHALHRRLPAECTLWLVPTDYTGTGDTAYLETLGTTLHPQIEVAWSGRSVVSPEISGDEARRRARCLRRRLLVWDNFPVNDGPMRNVLHLGPYTGRATDLAEHVSGVLCNPMERIRASAVGLSTAAAYLDDPKGYSPETAWRDAVRACGAGDPDGFARFAAAHRFSPSTPTERDAEVEDAFRGLCDAMASGDDPRAVARLDALRLALDARIAAGEGLAERLEDRALVEEIAPWITAHAIETRRMRIAVDLLQVLVEGAPSMDVALAFFRMEGRLTRIAPAAVTSYGPRRVVYPQLESLEDAGARFGRDPVLFVDQCLCDELLRFAESRALARLGGRPSPPRSE